MIFIKPATHENGDLRQSVWWSPNGAFWTSRTALRRRGGPLLRPSGGQHGVRADLG